LLEARGLQFFATLAGEPLQFNKNWDYKECRDFLKNAIPPSLFSHVKSRQAAKGLQKYKPFYLVKRSGSRYQVQVQNQWDGMDMYRSKTLGGASGVHLFLSESGQTNFICLYDLKN
jgi:hypothetical protein